MAKSLKILGVHGLGDHRNSTWMADWTQALRETLPAQDRIDLGFEFVSYDPIFKNVDISFWEAAKSVSGSSLRISSTNRARQFLASA